MTCCQQTSGRFFTTTETKKKTISSSAVHKLSTGETLGLSYLLCYTENLVYAFVGDIMVHVDAADAGGGEVGSAGGDAFGDDAAVKISRKVKL